MPEYKHLYRYTLQNANEFDEVEQWRESHRENCKCANDITDAINKFKDATQELAEKTGELNDGVDEFSREGIDELSGKVTDAMDDLNDVLDTAKAALDQSKEYRSYAGAADTMETSVKFIMKTDEIKLPEEKTTVVETKTEVKTSFWDRVKNLFH